VPMTQCCQTMPSFERLSLHISNGDHASVRKTPNSTRCPHLTCLSRAGGGYVIQSQALEFLRWHRILKKTVSRLGYLLLAKHRVSDDTSKPYSGAWTANRCDSSLTYGRTTTSSSTQRPFSSDYRQAQCRVTVLGRPHRSLSLNNGWLLACRNSTNRSLRLATVGQFAGLLKGLTLATVLLFGS
jgi:hypothetical protein